MSGATGGRRAVRVFVGRGCSGGASGQPCGDDEKALGALLRLGRWWGVWVCASGDEASSGWRAQWAGRMGGGCGVGDGGVARGARADEGRVGAVGTLGDERAGGHGGGGWERRGGGFPRRQGLLRRCGRGDKGDKAQLSAGRGPRGSAVRGTTRVQGRAAPRD